MPKPLMVEPATTGTVAVTATAGTAMAVETAGAAKAAVGAQKVVRAVAGTREAAKAAVLETTEAAKVTVVGMQEAAVDRAAMAMEVVQETAVDTAALAERPAEGLDQVGAGTATMVEAEVTAAGAVALPEAGSEGDKDVPETREPVAASVGAAATVAMV